MIFEFGNRPLPLNLAKPAVPESLQEARTSRISLRSRLARRATDPAELRRWAMRWHALGEFEEFDAGYLAALGELVMDNVERRSPPDLRNPGPQFPFLKQVRTSEKALDWDREMREFNLDRGATSFRQVTVKQTPDLRFLEERSPENRALADFINANSELIKLNGHTVANEIRIGSKSVPMLAGSALIPDNDPDFHWDARGIRDRQARRFFSMNTCTGCHAGDTGTTGFLHIGPRRRGESSRLSAFLSAGESGIRVRDPARAAHRDELDEMGRRIRLFETILGSKTLKPAAVRGLKAERAGWAH